MAEVLAKGTSVMFSVGSDFTAKEQELTVRHANSVNLDRSFGGLC